MQMSPRNLLTLMICLYLALHLAAGRADDLISRTCQTTPDRSMCESSLRSDPRSAGAGDAEGLIRIMIDIVSTKFSDSLRYVRDLERKEARDPALLKALKECERRFRVVIEANVIVATSAVNLGDPKFGENAMSDSAIEAAVCERAISCTADREAGTCRADLVEKAKFLKGLSTVAAAMIKILE